MYFPVGFVADENLHVQVVAGRVEIIEGADFASDLQTVVLKKDVLGL